MKEDVSLILQRTADQIRAGAEILLAKTRDWQVIKAYLSNRVNEMELTPTQQIKKKRYQFIYEQLVSDRYSEREVINQVVKIYEIGLTQAYEDLKCTREIYNSLLTIDKRFEQKMELESARSMKRKCIELNDFKAAAAVQKNIVMLMKDLLDDIENPELFEGHSFEVTFDPALLGAPPVNMKELLTAINDKRSKKINTDMFEEIPHVDVPNGKEDPLQ